MRARWFLMAAAAAIFTGCQQKEREDAARISLDEVPPAARAALERETGGQPLTHVEREEEGGRAVYEAEYTKDGKTWSVEVDENGKVLENEADDEEDED